MSKKQNIKRKQLCLVISAMIIVILFLLIAIYLCYGYKYRSKADKESDEKAMVKNEIDEQMVYEDKNIDLEITYLGSAKLKDSTICNRLLKRSRGQRMIREIYIMNT